MYYLFKAALVTWHSGTTVQANFTTGNPYDNINTALWDSSEPLLAPAPDIQCSIDTQWPRLDLYRVGLFHIISSKLAGIFQKYAVKHETFPVHLVDKEDTNVTLEIYYLFRLLEMLSVIHAAQERMTHPSPMFRVLERREQIYVYEDVKRAIEREHIRGVECSPRDLSVFL